MSRALAAPISTPESLGVDMGEVYQHTLLASSEDRFPTFEEIYEEYTTMYIERYTNLKNKQIDRRLLLLKDAFSEDIFSVENGFNPHDFGVARELQLFDALLFYQVSFWFKGHLYNQPVVEVW